ncbi:MAG: hypothetical protein HPY52_10825 [Firmicutes bacterium]|nr:hypothetical protein [Bacillota bacterium]
MRLDEWVRATFRVIPDGWMRQDFSKEDAFEFSSKTTDGESTSVIAPISWFMEHFGGADAPPTASALKAQDPNDETGWHRHFDAWAAQGIIQP